MPTPSGWKATYQNGLLVAGKFVCPHCQLASKRARTPAANNPRATVAS